MARNIFDLLGDFVLMESEFTKPGKVKEHCTITLLALDREHMSELIEIYPTTDILNVFLNKDATTPIDLLNPNCHLTEEEHMLLNNSPLAGGAVCLDQNGWIPMEYMDKKYIAMYIEFPTYEQMLAESTYTLEEDYGRLVFVWDIRGERPDIYKDEDPVWGVYRLVGDPHSPSGWIRIMTEGYDSRLITWDDVARGLFKSTIEEIDKMVTDSHLHDNLPVLENLSIDVDDGRLMYKGKRVMYRSDYNALLMDVKPDQLDRLRGGDSGSIVYEEHAIVPPIPATYVDTTDIDTIDEFYKDRGDISEILLMDTTKYTSFTKFALNCFQLEIVPGLDYSNAESLTESYKNCTQLTTFYGIDIPKATSLLGTWENCKRLSFIGTINNGSGLVNINNIFRNCESLLILPNMNYESVKYFLSFAEGCSTIKEFEAQIKPVNFTKAFKGCINLEKVSMIDFSRCRELTDCFANCPKLNTVDIVPGTLTKSISFKGTSLRISSATSIIEGLPNVQSATIDLVGTPASGISEATKEIAASKGWAVLV